MLLYQLVEGFRVDEAERLLCHFGLFAMRQHSTLCKRQSSALTGARIHGCERVFQHAYGAIQKPLLFLDVRFVAGHQ